MVEGLDAYRRQFGGTRRRHLQNRSVSEQLISRLIYSDNGVRFI
jgi:hypothetical protein